MFYQNNVIVNIVNNKNFYTKNKYKKYKTLSKIKNKTEKTTLESNKIYDFMIKTTDKRQSIFFKSYLF